MIDGLGERLKTAFKKKKITMNECAKALKLAQTTLSGYVTGSTDPTATKLLHIAKYLGVSVDWLMGLSNEMFPKAEPAKKVQPPKTTLLTKKIIVSPCMTDDEIEELIAEYLGWTQEAIKAQHNCREHRFKWVRTR